MIFFKNKKFLLGKTLFNKINYGKQYSKPSKKWSSSLKSQMEKKTYLYFNAGGFFFVFGLCYFAVPFYKLFCEKVGINGDLEQKNYSDIQRKKKC